MKLCPLPLLPLLPQPTPLRRHQAVGRLEDLLAPLQPGASCGGGGKGGGGQSGGGRGAKPALEVEVGTAGGLKVGGGGKLYFLPAGVDAGALVVTGLGLAGGAAGLGATGVAALSRPEAAILGRI